MTAASRSLATALSGARFASGWLRPCYTTAWDTTGASDMRTEHKRCKPALNEPQWPGEPLPRRRTNRIQQLVFFVPLCATDFCRRFAILVEMRLTH